MLGPSILFASPPFCIGYALNASLYARPKVAAFVGLALATAELLTLVVLMMVGS
jgi:hypothetical protein